MELAQQPAEKHASFKKSWTAYFWPVIVFLVMLAIGIALISVNNWLGCAFLLFAVGMFAFKVLTIRSLVLYTDDHGVWVYSGILPWSKGISGVKWRDLEDAMYFTNFLSWLLKSYTVRVGYRFTKTAEIVLPHISRGNDAVVHINELHRQSLSGGNVENLS